MITTPENDATTWYDLTDQLTLEQIAHIRGQEQNPTTFSWQEPKTTDERRRDLVDLARGYGRGNLHAALYADVPEPAGALKVGDWYAHASDGRPFDGRSWVVDGGGWHPSDIPVWIQGIQTVTGEVRERVIFVGDYAELTSSQARQLGEALIAAADEMDGLSD